MKHLNLSKQCTTSQIPKKALYLLSKEPSLLLHKDHRLILQRPEKADCYFPLARIERIVANNYVRWSGNAIMMTLFYQIPITWVNSKMESLGYAAPKQLQAYDLNDSIAMLVENDDWQELYANLLKSLRQVVLDWLFNGIETEKRLTNEQYHDLKKTFVYQGHVDIQLPMAMRAVCESHLTKQLEMAGMKLHYVTADGKTLALAQDLSELLWAMVNLDLNDVAATSAYDYISTLEKWLKSHPYIVVEFLAHIRTKLLQNWYGEL
ncbi:hypothetical protein AAEX37_01116 [Oligella sp. MSHR50489EDL]|uniref:hypothetical protein n=1 Tax=Oligella sp. MSHR50489EDL TaxID=3139409 RepID=UPI003D81A614